MLRGDSFLIFVQPGAGQFCSFSVPANPSADPAAKVSMGTSQASDYFQFDVKGEAKWETEVVGELEGGNSVKFHCTVVNTVCARYIFLEFNSV
jgi:hypothetical protein